MNTYKPEDFDPPLSDDAVIMLGFVQEKKRRMIAWRRVAYAIAALAFAAGMLFENAVDLLP